MLDLTPHNKAEPHNLSYDLDALCQRLRAQQPEAKRLLERLLARRPGEAKQAAFAEIKGGRCCGCNMAVATSRIQEAKTGTFITCANCSRFLYYTV
jgi:hypothetical protein